MVSPVSSIPGTAPSDTAQRIPQKQLGQNDFLKLLTVQLSKQDPMKPMEDTSFIAQMAQFTSLQQTTEMTKGFASLKTSSDLATASSLLGREVTVTNDKKIDVTGAVSGIDATDGTPRLMIDGKLYPMSALKRIDVAAQQPAA